MTDAELDALDRLCQEAARGQWSFSGKTDILWTKLGEGREDTVPVAILSSSANDPFGEGFLPEQAQRNGAFLAAARAALPQLVAEVRRLRAKLNTERNEPHDFGLPPFPIAGNE